MKLKKISFDEKGFRKLKNIEIPIAPYITAIAGHNGIGKSTILGLIANCSGLSKGEKSFFGKVFQSNFQEAFHLDYFQDYDNYHINGTKKADTPKVTVQYHVETNQDGSFIELNKICAVSIQKHAIKERLYKNHMIKVPEDKHIDPNHSLDLEDFDNNSLSSSSEPLINIWRLRIIPRTQQLPNTPEIEVLDEKLKGAGKMPIPTLYLGMSRMTPIGEFDAELIDKKTIRKMNGEDKNFIVDSFKDVLYFDESNNEITAHSFSSSKKSSYLPSFPYHSFTVSLGQDSLSSIVTALASFNYLKRASPQTYSGGILVIDEVDAGLHPRAQEKLINLLHIQARKLNLQIILTTHSLTVIKTILSKNEHPGEKVNDVVYLQDSNFPRIMENPTYTKIKNDMLVLAPLEDKPETIKLYFEDDEALFFFKQILKYKNIIHDKDYFGKELELISLSVGCNILLDLHKGDSYFQSVILIPDNDVFSSESNRKTIEENPASYKRLYDNDLSVQEKIEKIVTEIYRGSKVNFEKKAQTQIAQIVQNGWDKLPICMAKTQYSFSDNPNALGAPENFEITIRELVPKLGAGFIVALTGDVMTMPGLPKRPAALNMDVESDGTVLGLF